MNSMWGKLNQQDQQWLTIQRMFLEILYINFYLYLSLEIWALFMPRHPVSFTPVSYLILLFQGGIRGKISFSR